MRDFDAIKKKEMSSIENRIRHIYNVGYEDCLKDQQKAKDEVYKQGLEDAWQCCKRFSESDSGKCNTIWGYFAWDDFLGQSPFEALEKVKEYDKKHFDLPESMRGEINIGDEVKIMEEDGIFRAIVIQRDNTKYPYTIMYDNGDTQHVVDGSLEKTGRHFDAFENLLKQMRDDE